MKEDLNKSQRVDETLKELEKNQLYIDEIEFNKMKESALLQLDRIVSKPSFNY